jgi:hypothetical protein
MVPESLSITESLSVNQAESQVCMCLHTFTHIQHFTQLPKAKTKLQQHYFQHPASSSPPAVQQPTEQLPLKFKYPTTHSNHLCTHPAIHSNAWFNMKLNIIAAQIHSSKDKQVETNTSYHSTTGKIGQLLGMYVYIHHVYILANQ